ncbi:DEAD/DEAH box helicase [Acidianus brierleyi]|uniref:ATP-dependent helicase n=1 Tax=Acidianus brierleyi TaxID=41673 RepID=A0A2U9IGS8_9CREN|nr:DEAD/DEAH box helicase [Acidianus brierleyi]AWR95258.1 hypothetical protein DFR85_12275 [Acidianus brierleyi]
MRVVHAIWNGKNFGIWIEDNKFGTIKDLLEIAWDLDFYPEFNEETIIFPVDEFNRPVFYDYSGAVGLGSFNVFVAETPISAVFKIFRKKVDNLVYSPSTMFWKNILITTLQLIKSGRIIPVLNGSIKWKPLISDEDIYSLANEAPPDAFLENSNRAEIIKSFMEAVISAIATEVLGSDDFITLHKILQSNLGDKHLGYTLYLAILYNENGGKIISGLYDKDDNKIITSDIVLNSGDLRKIYYELVSSISDIYPKLNGLLIKDVELSIDELNNFLDIVPKLIEKGVKVFTKVRKLKPVISINSDTYNLFSAEELTSFDYKISLGDKEISEDEFEKLVNENKTIIDIGGNLVEIDSSSLRRIKSIIEKIKQGKLRKIDILRESLVGNLNIKNDLLDGLNKKESVQLLEPYNLKAILRPYQVKGFSWIRFMNKLGLGVCLADDMGLGKTIQTIAAFSDAKIKGELSPSLVICPLSVLKNWEEELTKFAPDLSFLVFHKNRIKFKSNLNNITKFDVVLTTYNILLRDTELRNVEWNYIVLDEAQNIKNPNAKISKAIRELKSKYRLALTGTPIENKVDDLWSIMSFLNPGLLGSYNEFKERFANPIKNGDPKVKEELRSIISPFVLRRTKYDKEIINDLPEKIETNVYCNLSTEQAAMYKAQVDKLLDKIDAVKGMKRKGIILSTILKLKEIVDHPALIKGDEPSIERSGKMIRTIDIVREALDEGDKIAIFTQFVEMGKILKNTLEREFKIETPFIYGKLSKAKRDNLISKFQNNPSVKFIVLSVKAGGFGINLTSANRVIHFDRWWNPAVEDQATDRTYRIGQTKNVIVHKLVTIGTLEEKIDQMLSLKRSLFKDIIASGDSWITELNTEDLKKVIELSSGD